VQHVPGDGNRVAFLIADHALINVAKAHPALEHHQELKVDGVAVQTIMTTIEMLGLDDVRVEFAMGCVRQAEVTIDEFLAQTVSLELRILRSPDDKAILFRPFGSG